MGIKLFILCLFTIASAGIGEGVVNNIYPREDTGLYLHNATHSQSYIPMSKELWQYLRAGLHYLEASGKDYPPGFRHPGGKAFGPLGLSRMAAQDVIRNNPALSRFTLEDVFTRRAIYEQFARHYADLLLRHYLGIDYCNMPREQVFEILQRAWFQGPSAYKQNDKLLPSRETRCREYVLRIAASPQ